MGSRFEHINTFGGFSEATARFYIAELLEAQNIHITSEAEGENQQFMIVNSEGDGLQQMVEGEASQRALEQARANSKLRILGPNCLGLVRPAHRFDCSIGKGQVRREGRVRTPHHRERTSALLNDQFKFSIQSLSIQSVLQLMEKAAGSGIDVDTGILFTKKVAGLT